MSRVVGQQQRNQSFFTGGKTKGKETNDAKQYDVSIIAQSAGKHQEDISIDSKMKDTG
jgi:hypothetical protein